jgi:stearoyl-CoA desaturase (Delta-9 desaturase)
VKATVLSPQTSSWFHKWFGWLDSHYISPQTQARLGKRVRQAEFDKYLPFIVLHLGCLGVLWTGFSPIALMVAFAMYWFRMFAITGFYHRYFSHKTFKTSRVMQFIFALWGSTAIQKGALWWSANHRHHHQFSDQPEDIHSPKQSGLWWSQLEWITDSTNLVTRYDLIQDWKQFPELVFLNRFDWIGPLLYTIVLMSAGSVLHRFAPQYGTDAWQLLVWGVFISTVVLFHFTSTINSLSHTWGSRRYETTDTSRNNGLLAIFTMGEGWHNNHHRFQGTVRQGFFWWEIDATFYLLTVMSWLGLVWDLRSVPKAAYSEAS